MFLPSSLLILSSIGSAPFLVLSNAFFISFIEFSSSRISFCFFFYFYNFNLFGKDSFYLLVLFQSSLSSLSEFSCSLLNFFIMVSWILYQLDCNIPCLWVWLLEIFHFLFCDIVLPWFFIVFDETCLCHCIWSCEHLSYLGKALFTSTSSTGWQLEKFLLFSRRWLYRTSFWFLLPELTP